MRTVVGLVSYLIPQIVFAASPATDFSFGSGACQNSEEKWVYSASLEAEMNQTAGPEWKELFENTLRGKLTSARGFAEALAVRRLSRSPESQAFGEYWMSRSLIAGGLLHIGHAGFQALAGRLPKKETAGIQTAALQCLSVIHRKHPGLLMGEASRGLVLLYKLGESSSLQEVAFERLLERVGDADAATEIGLLAKILKDAPGTLGHAANGLIALSQKNHHDAVAQLKRALAAQPLPEIVRKFKDPLRILLARELYAAERFDEASEQYALIPKTSNELVRTLTEMSWTHLRSGRYGESVGAAIGLQSGGLKNVFAPESHMIMAIALNELCEYPEALKAIHLFRKRYGPSYDWLMQNPDLADGYSAAVSYAQNGPASLGSGKPPRRVINEWIRSPLFIAHQERINLTYQEQKAADRIQSTASFDQVEFAKNMGAAAKDLRKRYSLAKIRLKPGQAISNSLIEEVRQLRRDLVHYRRLKAAGPIWKKVLASHSSRVPMIKKNLVASINAEFRRLNQRMRAQLEAVAENHELIEIEILNGATQDMVFQNANPEYKDLANQLKRTGKGAFEASKVYNWGAAAGGLEGADEVWEDELGSFRADLTDHCESRERYLQIRRKLAGAH